MDDLDKGVFNAILTWAPDRLSRNGGDLGRLVELMDKGRLLEILTHSQRFTDSPNEKFLLMILGSQAKLENDNRGINVKRGLKNKVEMGWRPGKTPLGYTNEHSINRGQNRVFVDETRAQGIRTMFEMVGHQRASGRTIHAYLKESGFRTRSGKCVTLSSVYLMLKNPFYHGAFEYPVGSGKWYKGAHDPILTKELFDRVQDQLCVGERTEYGQKEFQFVRMFRCGSCGSAFSAQEKTKKNKGNGVVRRYVYYGCSRGKDRQCREPYVSEKDLTNQLTGIIDSIDIDKIGIKKKISEELEKFQALATVLGQASTKVRVKDADIRKYAKHVLVSGSREEKREILEHIQNAVVIHDRVLQLA